MPNPKYTLSDIMRHIRELMRCIISLEGRIRDLERPEPLENQNESAQDAKEDKEDVKERITKDNTDG